MIQTRRTFFASLASFVPAALLCRLPDTLEANGLIKLGDPQFAEFNVQRWRKAGWNVQFCGRPMQQIPQWEAFGTVTVTSGCQIFRYADGETTAEICLKFKDDWTMDIHYCYVSEPKPF